MRVLPGETIAFQFIARTSSGAAAQADALPTATLARNSIDTVEVVTVTHVTGGIYRAEFVVPAGWSYGDVVEVRAALTMIGTPVREIVWRGVIRRITTAIKGPVGG